MDNNGSEVQLRGPRAARRAPALPARLGAVWLPTSGQPANLQPETRPVAERSRGPGAPRAGGAHLLHPGGAASHPAGVRGAQ